MNIIKTVMVAAALILPMYAPGYANAALNSDEQVEFTDALSTGKVKVVQKYLKQGADVNDLYFAWSALQIAANKGQLTVVKLLVDNGANIDYKHPITKMTSLDLAAYDGYPEIVKYLASKGADINIKLRGGVSIVRAVRDTGDTKMVDLLLSLGAKDDGCQTDSCN